MISNYVLLFFLFVDYVKVTVREGAAALAALGDSDGSYSAPAALVQCVDSASVKALVRFFVK